MNLIDKQILSLHNEGKSLRQIAKHVGMSHVGVKKRLDRIPDQNTITIEANTYGFEYKHPMQKLSINNIVSKLNSFLEELDLDETDKKIIVNPGYGWRFEKVPR